MAHGTTVLKYTARGRQAKTGGVIPPRKVKMYRVRVFIRDFTMLLVKRWLLKIIVILSKIYPEPVDIWHPNARILFRTLNKYMEYEQNNGRKKLIEAALRIGLDEYQRHTFYRFRGDWFVYEIKDDWLPRSVKPMSLWSEPRQVYEGTLYPTEALSEIM